MPKNPNSQEWRAGTDHGFVGRIKTEETAESQPCLGRLDDTIIHFCILVLSVSLRSSSTNSYKYRRSEMDRGGWSVRSLIIITVALQMVAATVAAPPGDLISSLPGQPEVSFKQYSGYITVNETHGRKLFYYFVEAANSSANAPLVLWLNGGPGCSSLVGAFSELGPFNPNTAADGLILKNASWNQVANLIFLESPAGVGFSYSNDSSDYITNDEKTAQDALAFLLGWLAEYPEYNSTDFYITGESYAGHYIPQLATAVLNNNKVSGQPQIQLKGIMVGNPLFDKTIDFSSRYEYAWAHGMVSEATFEAILQECNFTSPIQTAACENAEAVALEQSGFSTSSYLNPYDVLVDVCLSGGEQALKLVAMTTGINFTLDPCIENEVGTYLNLANVERSMHTEVSGWTECANGEKIVYSANDSNIEIAPLLANLVNSSLRVWVYSGDADMVIPVIGTRKIVSSVAANLKLDLKSDYHIWFQGCQIGGWSISWGSLVFATVRGAGHMVPEFQPARSLQLFTSFLAGDNAPPLQPGTSC